MFSILNVKGAISHQFKKTTIPRTFFVRHNHTKVGTILFSLFPQTNHHRHKFISRTPPTWCSAAPKQGRFRRTSTNLKTYPNPRPLPRTKSFPANSFRPQSPPHTPTRHGSTNREVPESWTYPRWAPRSHDHTALLQVRHHFLKHL